MKRAITVLFFLVIITPTIAFASTWWKPWTWKVWDIFQRKTAPVETVVTAPAQIDLNISDNTDKKIDDSESIRKELEELKKQLATNKNNTSTKSTQATTSVTSSAVETKPKTFTLQSGAVVDENGNILKPAPISDTSYSIQQVQPAIETSSEVSFSSLTSSYGVNALSDSSLEFWYTAGSFVNGNDIVEFSVDGIKTDKLSRTEDSGQKKYYILTGLDYNYAKNNKWTAKITRGNKYAYSSGYKSLLDPVSCSYSSSNRNLNCKSVTDKVFNIENIEFKTLSINGSTISDVFTVKFTNNDGVQNSLNVRTSGARLTGFINVSPNKNNLVYHFDYCPAMPSGCDADVVFTSISGRFSDGSSFEPKISNN